MLPKDLTLLSVFSESNSIDAYFSADVETDGLIPGPYSILSFASVYAGRFDRSHFERPEVPKLTFFGEMKPFPTRFRPKALVVNGLDRDQRLD
jgi:hypothetical protein